MAVHLLVLLNHVDVMDEIVYSALNKYYDVLGKTGYLPDSTVRKLLLLSFYKDFVFSDYRGLLSKEDYYLIERALNCLYGSDCLIPYPDYLKMGRLHLGEMTEMAHRVKVLEETPVLKVSELYDSATSDVYVEEEET